MPFYITHSILDISRLVDFRVDRAVGTSLKSAELLLNLEHGVRLGPVVMSCIAGLIT